MTFDVAVLDGYQMAKGYESVFGTLADSKGRLTGVMYGFFNSILGLKTKFDIDRYVIMWDSPRLRKTIDTPNYKNKNDFDFQLSEAKRVLAIFGVEQYFSVGYEADDLAARFVKNNPDLEILLVSKDEDWNLMFRNNVCIYRKGNVNTYDQFLKIAGMTAIELHLFLAITGTHNNLKGISWKNKDEIKNLVKEVAGSVKMLFDHCLPHQTKKQKGLKKEILDNEELIKGNHAAIGFMVDDYPVEEVPRVIDRKKLIDELSSYELKSVLKRLGVDLADSSV